MPPRKPKPKPKKTMLTQGSKNAAHGQPGHVHQSGDDWGTEDLDDYFGTDLANMDPMETTTTINPDITGTDYPHLPEALGGFPTTITTETGNINPALEAGIKGDTNTKLPEESNDPNWSSDYTDSGVPGADLDGEDEPPEPGEPGHLDWYKKRRRESAGASNFASMNVSANTGTQRRNIRAMKTLLTGTA